MLTNLSRRDLIANLEVCAERLAGIPVTVRIVDLPRIPLQPARDGTQREYRVNGAASKDYHGRAVIYLDAAIFDDIKLFAEVFCHEASHIVRHFRDMPRWDISEGIAKEAKAQALHLTLASDKRGNPIANKTKRKEDEADELAAGWMAIVKAHYGGYEASTHDPIMAVLKILYHKVNR